MSVKSVPHSSPFSQITFQPILQEEETFLVECLSYLEYEKELGKLASVCRAWKRAMSPNFLRVFKENFPRHYSFLSEELQRIASSSRLGKRDILDRFLEDCLAFNRKIFANFVELAENARRTHSEEENSPIDIGSRYDRFDQKYAAPERQIPLRQRELSLVSVDSVLGDSAARKDHTGIDETFPEPRRVHFGKTTTVTYSRPSSVHSSSSSSLLSLGRDSLPPQNAAVSSSSSEQAIDPAAASGNEPNPSSSPKTSLSHSEEQEPTFTPRSYFSYIHKIPSRLKLQLENSNTASLQSSSTKGATPPPRTTPRPRNVSFQIPSQSQAIVPTQATSFLAPEDPALEPAAKSSPANSDTGSEIEHTSPAHISAASLENVRQAMGSIPSKSTPANSRKRLERLPSPAARMHSRPSTLSFEPMPALADALIPAPSVLAAENPASEPAAKSSPSNSDAGSEIEYTSPSHISAASLENVRQAMGSIPSKRALANSQEEIVQPLTSPARMRSRSSTLSFELMPSLEEEPEAQSQNHYQPGTPKSLYSEGSLPSDPPSPKSPVFFLRNSDDELEMIGLKNSEPHEIKFTAVQKWALQHINHFLSKPDSAKSLFAEIQTFNPQNLVDYLMRVIGVSFDSRELEENVDNAKLATLLTKYPDNKSKLIEQAKICDANLQAAAKIEQEILDLVQPQLPQELDTDYIIKDGLMLNTAFVSTPENLRKLSFAIDQIPAKDASCNVSIFPNRLVKTYIPFEAFRLARKEIFFEINEMIRLQAATSCIFC